MDLPSTPFFMSVTECARTHTRAHTHTPPVISDTGHSSLLGISTAALGLTVSYSSVSWNLPSASSLFNENRLN